MTNKIKLIFCTDGIFPNSIGGMQRHSRLLIEALAKSNLVDIIVLHPHSPGIFSAELSIKEITIKPLDINKNYLLECYRYSKRVYEILIKYPDFIIYSQGLCVWYNIKNIGNRTIVNPHGLEPYQALSLEDKLKSIPFKIIFNHIFKYAAIIVSLGGKLTEILEKILKGNRQKIIVLPNGVSCRGISVSKEFNKMKLKMLFVARFAHNKGIHILMEAIKQLNEEGYSDKLELTLGGKGPLFNHYFSTFKYHNIKYLGFVTDEQLTELYSTEDVFVFPTLFEGMPTVVLEAMSYGLPIIVSDVGATAELVDAKNGYLIQRNNIEQLKKAITDFYILNTGEKKGMSVSSLEKIKQKYTWEIVAQSHIQLFKKMAG